MTAAAPKLAQQMDPRPVSEGRMLKDLLQLSYVPRWVITPVNRQQTVAEHSFRVAVIAWSIARRIPELISGFNDIEVLLKWALVHDATESYTGDIPSPAKDFYDDRRAVALLTPWLENLVPMDLKIHNVVKLADSIEALSWLTQFGGGERSRFTGEDIELTLRQRIHRESRAMGEEVYTAVKQVLGEVAP
jgi:5'-deoxynucleotidase YfbR-like HD superfamily hydrolase